MDCNLMSKLKSIISNLQALKAGALKTLVVNTLEENKSELEDNQTDQMSKGENSQGQPIGFYRSFSYASFKKSIGGKAPLGVVDLNLTGSFQSKTFAQVTSNTVSFNSTDSKTEDLTQKYTENIFGLNAESWMKFNNEVLFPNLKPKVIKYING